MSPGDEIICINSTKADGVDYSMFPSWVKEGEKYTIRRIEGSVDAGKRILVDQLSNPKIPFPSLGGNVEPGFSIKRFANYEDYVMGNVEEEELETEKVN